MEFNSQQIIIDKHNFLGLSVSSFDRNQLVSYIESTVESNSKKILFGHSLGTFTFRDSCPEMYTYGEQSDVLVTDGRFFYLLAKLHGLPLKYDISVPALVNLTLQLANKNKWSVYLLGAKKEENFKAQSNIKIKYPGISVISGNDGYFSDEKSDLIISKINSKSFNVLLIGMPSPNKEKIAVEWKEKLNVNIIIPCGGMIDVLSGKTKQTPLWLKKLGLASFYRFSQEPRRLFWNYTKIYWYIFSRFLPSYFYNVIIKRRKDHSFYDESKSLK